MPVTQSLNSKANVKKYSNQDLPFSPQQPVMSSFYAVSTNGQTVINMSFSVDTVNLTDQFFLFIDGKKLRLGSTNDYTFTSVGSDGKSSQVTLTQTLPASLNIQAFQLGLKKETEFGTDSRFTQLYEAEGNGFQGFVNTTSFLNTATNVAGTPAAGTFYSTIIGRAPMVDLSQDLKPRMAVERILVQQIYRLQNEFGPNGEPIWITPNDLFGQIRWGGIWFDGTINDSGGQRFLTTTVNDFCEVTFYGTGLNLLIANTTTASDMRASVDGGSEGANLWATTASSSLVGRNYSVNQPVSVVSGLSLGVHTVKFRLASATGMSMSGFEILNESANIKVNPGVGYLQGKKYTTSAQSSFAYNASVTGTRGGRVVVYQNGDGTIGQSFQAVNASAQTLTSADHTNEEVVRVYDYRTFGAGRTDDFSSTLSAATRNFTLDDGVTSLVANVMTEQSSGAEKFLSTDANGSYVTFTFIGTGVDFLEAESASGGADSYNAIVDGVTSLTIAATGNTQPRVTKIISGLPYGTHTLKIIRNSATTYATRVAKFFVYQPKKPSIPSGAIELSDYNVFANFVANTTAGTDNLSTGVMRKTSARELLYVGAGWSSTLTTFVTHPTGQRALTSTNTDYAEYVFFGTGFEFRNTTGGTDSASVLVSLQSLTTGGSLQTLNSTNFPGLTTSAYGNITFTYSTGVLNTSGTATAGNGAIVSGLTLGMYKVRFTNQAANAFQLSCLDIITPIHSIKTNSPFDVQNSLPVGSQGISDNRKFTPVKDVLPIAKNVVIAQAVANQPTTTGTNTPLPDMALTIKTSGGKLKLTFTGAFFNSAANNYTNAQFSVDGFLVGQLIQCQAYSTNGLGNITLLHEMPVSPGVHEVVVNWGVSGGTSANITTQRVLIAEEI